MATGEPSVKKQSTPKASLGYVTPWKLVPPCVSRSARMTAPSEWARMLTRPAQRLFGVLMADGAGLWDAPFRKVDWVDVRALLREARAV